jgi:hypothetical protein
VVVVDQTTEFQQTHPVADWAAEVPVEIDTDKTALLTLEVAVEVVQITAQTAIHLRVVRVALVS